MKKILITTPIYYVNDKPHIGHAYTTLAADVLTRFFRTQGKDVFFLTGTDEHGAKIARVAEKEGKDPKKFCDENAKHFKDAWANLNIEYDHFVRTTDKAHEQKVSKFIERLKDKKAIYEKEYEGLYCSGCEKFITEKDLIDGECPDHKCKPEKISEKNWFFKLKDYLKTVEKLIDSEKFKLGPKSAKNETLGLLRQGLEDFSISRQKVKWGIPVPFDKNQTIYVWVDALLNYITGDGTDKFKKYWEDGYTIHLLAKDILKFHAIYWPAMLLAADYKISDQEFIHGFFTINGQKMSKTLGNVIDPNEIVKEFGIDGARYLMLSQFPFGQDGDIKQEKFAEKYNSDLANGLGNLVSRVLALANKIDLNILDVKPDKDTLNRAKQARDNYVEYMEDLKLFESLEEIWKLISWCDSYVEKNKPWELIKNDKNKAKEILSDLFYCISEISELIEPFLPETSDKIKKQLKSGKSEILFKRIDVN